MDTGEEEQESRLRTLLTITFPFFIAGFGMVAAGILLKHVDVSNLDILEIFEILRFIFWKTI